MNKYIDLLRLKIKGYIIIDDFFPDEICKELREKSYNAKDYNMKYWDYKSLDFDNATGDESLKYISDKYVVPKISLAKDYQRAWSFVYENVGRGVVAHADPSFINVNIWVTPDECVYDHNKNGLRIFRKRVPSEMPEWLLQQNTSYVANYLKDSKYDIIPYKYNRAVIFRGHSYHSTEKVHMKPGHENKRVNYTFLYE